MNHKRSKAAVDNSNRIQLRVPLLLKFAWLAEARERGLSFTDLVLSKALGSNFREVLADYDARGRVSGIDEGLN